MLVLEVDTSKFLGIGPRQSELCLLTYSIRVASAQIFNPKRIEVFVVITGVFEKIFSIFKFT